jgi:hypothetical protein
MLAATVEDAGIAGERLLQLASRVPGLDRKRVDEGTVAGDRRPAALNAPAGFEPRLEVRRRVRGARSGDEEEQRENPNRPKDRSAPRRREGGTGTMESILPPTPETDGDL